MSSNVDLAYSEGCLDAGALEKNAETAESGIRCQTPGPGDLILVITDNCRCTRLTKFVTKTPTKMRLSTRALTNLTCKHI